MIVAGGIGLLIFLSILAPIVVIVKVFEKFDEQKQRIDALQSQLNRMEDLKLKGIERKIDALAASVDTSTP